MTIRDKFDCVRSKLASTLIERETEIALSLAAIVSGEHLLLVGAPGLGKSLLFDLLLKWIDGPSFSALLTKFTAPEEVLGPLSLTALKADSYRRVTRGRLPEASICFLDEIWKASSAILNTLLRILNEGVYEQDGAWIKSPLRLCVAASNEWPNSENGAQELGAIFDRFALRYTVQPIRTASGEDSLLFGDIPPVEFGPSERITPEEIDEARREASALTYSAEGREALLRILRELAKEGIRPSDRRKRKAAQIAKAAAWLDGSAEVRPEHLEILAFVLWDDPQEQPRKAAQIVGRIANPAAVRVAELSSEAEAIVGSIDVHDLSSTSTALAKLAEIDKQLGAIGTDRATDARHYVRAEAKRVRQRIAETV